MAGVDLPGELVRDLRRHPRVVLQGFFEDAKARKTLADGLPAFLPFKGRRYASVLWVLDWDHRLPSKNLVLRLYAYYGDDTRRDGLRGFEERKDRIAREDLFPEFDVADFGGLPADEAYEAEMSPAEPPKKFRLMSEWRREIEKDAGRKAEDIVRKSASFQELASQMRTRPPGLGDLEAAEWASPAESGHTRWGMDVWYLRAFNGMVGEGTAFLVDLEEGLVVSQRDFQFRAS